MSSPFSSPDEVLTRLTRDPQVQGCLILLRSNGSILKSSGSLFAADVDSTTTTTTLAQEYALRCWNIVKALAGEVQQLAKSQGAAEEDVKFARIRTARHELIISPDAKYILVVVQDPSK